MSQGKVIILNIGKVLNSEDIAGGQQQHAYQVIKDIIEPEFLKALLAHTGNNKTHASRLAGFNVCTLNRKLAHYGLSVSTQLKDKGGV